MDPEDASGSPPFVRTKVTMLQRERPRLATTPRSPGPVFRGPSPARWPGAPLCSPRRAAPRQISSNQLRLARGKADPEFVRFEIKHRRLCGIAADAHWFLEIG